MIEELRDADDVRAWLATHVYDPSAAGPHAEKVGLEAELFPFWMAPDGRPAARMALVEVIGIVDAVPGAVRNPDGADGRPSWRLDGALITEEPGAQIEIAGPPEDDADTAIRGVERIITQLSAVFAEHGGGLAAAGLDCWSDDDEVPVQVHVPRYEAMTDYFNMRGGEYGHLLMCASCSLQINLDLGPPEVARQRWLVANLAAPVMTAAFAGSPRGDDVNGRAMGWRGLDPTRTGVAPPLVAGTDDPLEHALADALRADVLLVDRDGHAVAGMPGWSFGDWVRDGHPRWGHPTTPDLVVHLTTLFPESRLRGFLEVRGVDELPAPWRAAATALVVGLLYDPRALAGARQVLEPHRATVPELLERAAGRGLADEQIATLCIEVLDIAHDGAVRLGIPQADAAAAFLERFTHRRRHPSDELRAALATGPAEAFAWAQS
jgi:glutamate--cysteine ligase